jgi:hypothetical protein
MRTDRHTAHDQAMPQADHQVGWASRIRSISFVEIRCSAVIILNEAIIFAHRVFGR